MLKLNNGFYAAADAFGYSLHQLKKSEPSPAMLKAMAARGCEPKNEETDITVGYYGSLQSVLDGYVRTVLRQKIKDETLELQDVKRILSELREEIEKVNA